MTERKEGDLAFYEVTGYYCRYKPAPFNRCNQTAPGNEAIISVRPDTSGAKEYHKAFRKALKNAPKCPVHLEPMIPEITKIG